MNPNKEPSRGAAWLAALTADARPVAGYPTTVRVVDASLAAEPARYLAVVPDPGNPFPRVRNGEVGLIEGWALARAGRCREALPFARRALRLGTESPLLLFHLGYAEGCAGNRATMRTSYARALALDPEFSVRWAPVARAALRR